jgi:hypothetical protein
VPLLVLQEGRPGEQLVEAVPADHDIADAERRGHRKAEPVPGGEPDAARSGRKLRAAGPGQQQPDDRRQVGDVAHQPQAMATAHAGSLLWSPAGLGYWAIISVAVR